MINYTYDGLQRLVEADHSTGEKFEYGYDAVGNRTTYTATITSTVATTYTYDAANRLTNVGGVAYTWDDRGQLLDDGQRTYAFDAAGRLITVTLAGDTTQFAYNGDGDRLSKSVNSTLTTYTLDVAVGLAQVLVENSGENATVYLYGQDLIGEDGVAWAYHLNDSLGSMRQLVDEDGDVTLVQGTRPFGADLWQSGSGNSSFGYTGEQVDASTGLVFLRARYYDSATGRFISQDSWRGYPSIPQTLNHYTYAENNPVNLIDPSGHTPNPTSCSKSYCFVFYFPGTGKIDNDYTNYRPAERNFIDRLEIDFGADKKAVIFPFGKGNSYEDTFRDLYYSDAVERFLLSKERQNPLWNPSIAQWLQLAIIRKAGGYKSTAILKASEVSERLRQWNVFPGLPRTLEIDFVAHSGGTHIALNAARYMPTHGYKVHDVVGLGGLFKAYEWKETGSLSSIEGRFYDILSDIDVVRLIRDGVMPVTESDATYKYNNFDYTEWHSTEFSVLGVREYKPSFGNLANVERKHAGMSHSDYWKDEGVNTHLYNIICNKRRLA